MKELTNFKPRTLYLIENNKINFNRIYNKFNIDRDEVGYSNKNSIFWFSLNASIPKLYTRPNDESDIFDYMNTFIKAGNFDFIHRVYIGSDLKLYDAHRAMRTKKNKIRSIKGTK